MPRPFSTCATVAATIVPPWEIASLSVSWLIAPAASRSEIRKLGSGSPGSPCGPPRKDGQFPCAARSSTAFFAQ